MTIGEPTATETLERNDSPSVRVGAFDMPLSAFLDERTHEVLRGWERWHKKWEVVPGHWTKPETIPALRRYYDEHFFIETAARSEQLYATKREARAIAGVPTEIFEPSDAIAPSNRDRVLINLHGGGFTIGAPFAGRLESIPVAAIGKTRVISVDYRMAPEFEFPAATEDVIAVYRELLTRYAPQNVGIYGSSAGALLTAQVMARLQTDGLPLPGAIGMLFGGACYWNQGDSAHFGAARFGEMLQPMRVHPYFRNANQDDPSVTPLRSDRILSKFPQSLLIASTRDQLLSSVVHTHSRLVALDVRAELHVWEGLDHVFAYDPDVPQAAELHSVTVKFFNRCLGCP